MAIQMYAIIGAAAVGVVLLAGLGIQTWRIGSLKEDVAVAEERAEKATQELKREREVRKKVDAAAKVARRKAEEARNELDKLRRESAKGPRRDLTPARRDLYDRLQRRVHPGPAKPVPGK